MKFLLTNDDGIDAPGLTALRRAVGREIPGEIVVVAPTEQLSGCGHRVTTRQPILVEKRAIAAYAVAGTPADCTRLALYRLCPDADWVLSGINAGGNMGVDVYISGTVAAVREAALHGVPGIAISHYLNRRHPVDWERASRWTEAIVAELLQRPLEPKAFWNVNLPHLTPEDLDPEVVFCELSKEPLPINYLVEGDSFAYVGDYQTRDRTPGTDVDVCFSGCIAVTKVCM